MNKKSLLAGILLGIAVVVSLGIVYIDTVQNYWYVNGGFVKLVVSNQTAQAVMTVDTNTLRVGFNTNNILRSFVVRGQTPPTAATGNGTSANTTGIILLHAGDGGSTADPTTASGNTAGGVRLLGGAGGNSPAAITNGTGGTGGDITITSGTGGDPGTVATNQLVGGNAGNFSFAGSPGFSPSGAASNTVGGNGASFVISAGNGGLPSAGWTRKGGVGGGVAISAGAGLNSVRTNGGNGGAFTFTAGGSGSVTTTPGNAGTPGAISFTAGASGSAVAGGNPSPGANINFTAGAGSTGDTNSDGGHNFLIGGAPGSGAVPGNVVVGRTSAGTSRGGLQVGPAVVGTTATLTNLLTVTAVLDFPSIAAGTVADINVAFAGAADGDVVTLGVPLSSVTNCTWIGFASNAVVYVRAANGQLVTAQDPNSGTFRIVLQKFR